MIFILPKFGKWIVAVSYTHLITLAKACGVTKTGIVYYFPHKLDLLMAVADKYVLKMHEPENKFAAPADTLTEFCLLYTSNAGSGRPYSVPPDA